VVRAALTGATTIMRYEDLCKEAPFDGKMAVYKPHWAKSTMDYWDNVESTCHICNTHMNRTEGWYVHWPNSIYMPVKNFFVCSKECGEMFILQRC
jgi:hypothetical protein